MAQATVAQLSTWHELHALPAGAIVRDAEGDEYTKAKDARFKGIGGLDFTAFGLSVFAPFTLLNPEILSAYRFRPGDQVEVITRYFDPVVRLGETGTVIGIVAGFAGPLVDVRLNNGHLFFPFHNAEITPL